MAQSPTDTAGTWLPIAEAHNVAGVSRRSAYRWAKTGRVPTRTERGKLLVTVESLRAEASRPRCATVAHRPHGSGTRRKPAASPPLFDPPNVPLDPEPTHDEQLRQHKVHILDLYRRMQLLENKVFGSSRKGERRASPTKPPGPVPFKPPIIRNKPAV